MGDTGFIRSASGVAEVTDTRKIAGVFIHVARVTQGEITKGQPVKLEVDHSRRTAIRANHSATHLLHEALRRALGEHVSQKGSFNAPDRLRFDFSHGAALSAGNLVQIEDEVNAFIRQNTSVDTRIMTPDEARALGAQALFGEKYGDEVRVVSMGREANSGKGQDGQTYSLELCGGTHVARTGDIGAFVCLGDSASAAGIRRVEALTGQAALDYLRAQDTRLGAVAGMLKAPAQDVPDRVKALMDERRALANEISQLKRQIALGGGGAPGDDIQDIGGLRIIAKVMTGVSGKDLPAIIDAMKEKLSSGAVVLIADTGTKPAVAAGVTQDMTARISAVDLVRICVGELGGKGGGGRPDMAQGGGTDITGADRALAAVKSYLEGMHA